MRLSIPCKKFIPFFLLCTLLTQGCSLNTLTSELSSVSDVSSISYQSLLETKNEKLLYKGYTLALQDLSNGKRNKYKVGFDLTKNKKRNLKIYLYALYDHPEYSVNAGTKVEFQKDSFLLQKKDNLQLDKELKDNNALSLSTADGIYDWLTKNVSYVNDSTHCNDIYGALVEKKANCTGMSLAMKYLLNRQGIDAYVETGRTKDGKYHMWAAVKGVDTTYYDPTFGLTDRGAYKAMNKSERMQSISRVTLTPNR